MSTDVNVELYERAAQMIDYFEGKIPARKIELALHMEDMDELYNAVCEAESLAAQEELNANDVFFGESLNER